MLPGSARPIPDQFATSNGGGHPSEPRAEQRSASAMCPVIVCFRAILQAVTLGESRRGPFVATGKDCAARLEEPFRSAGHGDLLYDERGLPRRSSTRRS
jgi:hypothetical protein